MRRNVEKVFAAWTAGRAAIGDSKRTISTDGAVLYSYAMPIARRLPNGRVEMVERGRAPTATTRAQLSAVRTELAIREVKVTFVQSLGPVGRILSWRR
jgi:hypothetical protein